MNNQTVALDIGFRATTFDGHQPDHFLAALRQALRRAIGDIAECLDRFKHAPPGNGRTRSWPCTTRETVAVETPASRATS